MSLGGASKEAGVESRGAKEDEEEPRSVEAANTKVGERQQVPGR